MNLANKLTFTRLMLIPIFFAFAAPIPESLAKQASFFGFINDYGNYISVLVFTIAAITDKLDGFVARKYNQITKFGIFLDSLADKILITAALILLVQRDKISVFVALIIIGREFAVTGLRYTAAQKNIVLAADKFGKIKMVTQVAAIIAAMLNNYPISMITTFPFSDVLMLIAVVFTVLSGINYFIKNKNVFIDNHNAKVIQM